MNSQDLAHSTTEATGTPAPGGKDADVVNIVQAPAEMANGAPPPSTLPFLRGLSPFWHDRLIEAGLIVSLGLYYLVGNPNFGAGSFLHIPPYLYSLPFLILFAILSWYRLPFALALFPLALPYYMIQKTLFSYGSHQLNFSLAEIALGVCALVALGQFVVADGKWRYRLSLAELRERLGPFPLPILVFVVAALISIVIAADRQTALRAFREEVFDPLLYLFLAFCCLRTRQDIKRLLGALLGSAAIIAVIGLIQYFFFPNLLQSQASGASRVVAVYGSANSIGLFFDYALPVGMALLIFQVGQALRHQSKWWICLLILAAFIPFVSVLVLAQSLGTALALPVALLFILALSIRSRKVLLTGAGALLLLAAGAALVLHRPLTHLLTSWHSNSQGISTITVRYYLWLSALHMIQHHPWFGVGMDNWLCYYSVNNVCIASHHLFPHYWIIFIPGTKQLTGLTYQPTLSHPHDIFLQIWASIGIFGLLAFVAIVVLFYWLFARIFKAVRHSERPEVASLEWIILGIGGAMLAALCQGLVDSSFLEQDLAFCFWMLVLILLTLRTFTGTPWRTKAAS